MHVIAIHTQECFKSYPEVYSKYTEDEEEETTSTDIEDNKSTNNNNN